MGSLVLELEREAHNTSAPLSSLLRKAKVVAVKLNRSVSWIEPELNGYKTDGVPDYRKLRGLVRMRNPYVGLIPVTFADSNIEEIVTQYWCREPIEIVEQYALSKTYLLKPFTGEQSAVLSRMSDCPEFPAYLLLYQGPFQIILNAVRNQVLDWSLDLQKDGIIGEDMSFRKDEDRNMQESSNTYNIGSIGSFVGNLGGRVTGNITAASTPDVMKEFKKVSALIMQLRNSREAMELNAEQQANVFRHIDELDEELRGGKPKPDIVKSLLKSLKNVLEGAAGNLIASGALSALSSINL